MTQISGIAVRRSSPTRRPAEPTPQELQADEGNSSAMSRSMDPISNWPETGPPASACYASVPSPRSNSAISAAISSTVCDVVLRATLSAREGL